MSWHWAAQAWIVNWSLIGAFLMTSKQMETRKWGFVCGLISQPGWFYAVITAEQWGQLLMACVYTAMWIRGIKNNWEGK